MRSVYKIAILTVWCASACADGHSPGDAALLDDDAEVAEGGDTYPMKDGVPIGNCVEPTDAQLAESGCPLEPPSETACPTEGAACRYDLEVEGDHSQQIGFGCFQGIWSIGIPQPCGERCGAPLPNAIELRGGSCAMRDVAPCAKGDESFLVAPTAKVWLDRALEWRLQDCNADIGGNVMLELSGGCPTRLSSSGAFTTEQAQCLRSAFSDVRLDCAAELPCATRTVVLLGATE